MPKRLWVQYSVKAVENFQRGKLTGTRGTRTVYPSEQNRGLSLTFQPPEEGQSVQRLKHFDKHGNEDEDNSPKIVNDVWRQNEYL